MRWMKSGIWNRTKGWRVVPEDTTTIQRGICVAVTPKSYETPTLEHLSLRLSIVKYRGKRYESICTPQWHKESEQLRSSDSGRTSPKAVTTLDESMTESDRIARWKLVERQASSHTPVQPEAYPLRVVQRQCAHPCGCSSSPLFWPYDTCFRYDTNILT